MTVANSFEDRSNDQRLIREMCNQYCPYKSMNPKAFTWVMGLKNGLDRKPKISADTDSCYLEGYKVGVSN